MKQLQFTKPNDDPEMQPIVAHNKGRLPVRYKSILEVARPDLIEYDEHRVIDVHPGRRLVIPHGYFAIEVLGKGESRIEYHIGDRAPELRGYKRAYMMRVIQRPWYKKFSDFFTKG